MDIEEVLLICHDRFSSFCAPVKLTFFLFATFSTDDMIIENPNKLNSAYKKGKILAAVRFACCLQRDHNLTSGQLLKQRLVCVACMTFNLSQLPQILRNPFNQGPLKRDMSGHTVLYMQHCYKKNLINILEFQKDL